MKILLQLYSGALLLAFLSVGSRGDDAVTEANLKAAYLYNFTKFIEWPADSSASFDIGVLGGDAFASVLEKALSGKMVRGRPIHMRKVSASSGAEGCQIVFVQESDTRRAAEFIAKLKSTPTLTVGESDRFLESGGMINFFFDDKELRFQINLPACEAAHLVLNSKLVRLAKPVRNR